MAHYFIGYHGGEPPETPEEGKALMAKWLAWTKDLGEAMINPGTPLGGTQTVFSDKVEDSNANVLMGFSIVDAASMEDAKEIARKCPHLLMRGASLQVAEMKQMPSVD